MYRNTYIQVDVDKLKHNARFFQNNKNKEIIGVIKANGYGLIDYMEAKALTEVGVTFFAVSNLDEALNLRRYAIDGKILILGQVSSDTMDIIRKNDLSIVTLSLPFVKETDLKDVKVHLKIDTGMNRIGVKPEEAKECLDLLIEKGAIIEGVMSHFSSADEDEVYSKEQYQRFKDCVTSLNYPFPYIHMAATDASILIDDDICNAERIGFGLLGYSSYQTELRPCLSLYSEVSMVKQLKEGETVSYGRHYTSDGTGYLLTLPIGYADGFYRANTGHKVWCEDEYGTIVGSICMDQMMVLCQHYHPVGTKCELFGEHVDIPERAAHLGTIPYELCTSLSDRLTRKYVRDGKVFLLIDPRF